MATRKTPLQKAREILGFTSRRVAEALEIDISGFNRIETGENLPKRDTARRIYAFYGGLIPLGLIFDPTNKHYHGWEKEIDQCEVATLRAKLLQKRPELAERVKARMD